MAAVKRDLEGDRDLLCVAPIASCNDILRAASGFCDGPHEALGRGSPCAGGLNGETDDIRIWDIVAGLVLLDLRDLSFVGDVAAYSYFCSAPLTDTVIVKWRRSFGAIPDFRGGALFTSHLNMTPNQTQMTVR